MPSISYSDYLCRLPDDYLITLLHRIDKYIVVSPNVWNGTHCLDWVGPMGPKGYGRLQIRKRTFQAHRLVWATQHHDPKHLLIDHLCRNRLCCNTDHHSLKTSLDNTHAEGSQAVAARNRAKTHCPSGHEYSPENTYVRPSDNGRICLTCRKIYYDKYQKDGRYKKRK